MEYILKCNYNVKTWGLKIRAFWQEVFGAFALIHNQERIDSCIKIKEQLLNNNQHILINGESFYKHSLINNDMDMLTNWFHWTGEIKSFQEIKIYCDALTWLEYEQIRSAIPRSWKKILKSRVVIPTILAPSIWSKKEVKYLFRSKRFQKCDFEGKWNEMLQRVGGVEVNRETQTKKVFIITKEVKLQFFHYKILTKTIYTPKKAHIYKRADTDLCVFCKTEEGSIVHMYVECHIITQLYKEVIKLFNKNEEIKIDVNRVMLLMFYETNEEMQEHLNIVLLRTRYYIYQCFIQQDIYKLHTFDTLY